MNLLEIVGVLLIAALVLGGTALRIKSGRENEKVTTAQQNLSTLKLEVN
ncbi:pilus assembly protein PilS, partial [Marinifilum sp. JC120]